MVSKIAQEKVSEVELAYDLIVLHGRGNNEYDSLFDTPESLTDNINEEDLLEFSFECEAICKRLKGKSLNVHDDDVSNDERLESDFELEEDES
jgi:hypothetical protein